MGGTAEGSTTEEYLLTMSLQTGISNSGSSVKEIAEKVGKPIQHIYVWFSGTGKKLGMFDKMGEGKYRIKPAQH